MFSLLVPAYNEEGAVEGTVRTAHDVLTKAGIEFEIVVIDDGSTDGTAAILAGLPLAHVRVIRHARNQGYGASLKTGIRRSRGEVLGMTDADGTYPVAALPELLKALRDGDADMVVGARRPGSATIPLSRRPAKAIVTWLANALSGTRIPDVNSGLRVFRRDLAERFMSLYPQRFSFTITLTLAALTNHYLVDFRPIEFYRRTGESTLSRGLNGLWNFFAFLGIVVRMVVHFRPLRFFFWPSLALVLAGSIAVGYTLITERDVSDSGVLCLLAGLQVGLFGLLADAVVRSRQTR
ncbi:MAG TPA: glycosyltransferase family 2 protein [Methylomirabilota bacterium]|nr:glycosyltransferase family 2 protein [Methylomirabilota bacterium]